MFYHYSQNNSGGIFTLDENAGITNHVIIEANSTSEADEKAEAIGLYWDGCEEGMDCPCCGDRWSTYWGEPDEVPTVYDMELVDGCVFIYPWMKKGKEACVHYADGRKEWF